MRQRNLPRAILKDVGISSLQHARTAPTKTRSVIAELFSSAAGFHTDQLHLLVLNKIIENADRVRSATHASNDCRGKPARHLKNLRARLAPDNTMKIAHHRRIRMCTKHAPQQVMRRTDVSDPVAHRLVDGIFQSARAGFYPADFRAQQSHAKYI